MTSKPLKEVVLGRGDYIAGGTCTEPFLEQDGAIRRRPIILGEIAPVYDPFLAGMFSTEEFGPVEWALLWKGFGADGICVRTDGMTPEESVELVRTVVETDLPVAVDGPAINLECCARAIDDSTLILIGDLDEDESCGHAVATDPDHADRERGFIHIRGRFPSPERFRKAMDIRMDALNGKGCAAPIIFDVTPVWRDGFRSASGATVVEGQAALAAMLHGADVIIVKGPGAMDMALMYGEELAL